MSRATGATWGLSALRSSGNHSLDTGPKNSLTPWEGNFEGDGSDPVATGGRVCERAAKSGAAVETPALIFAKGYHQIGRRTLDGGSRR